MDKPEIVAHNFWAQAGNLGICDSSTGLDKLLDLIIKGNEDDFAEALERAGYTVTQD